MWQEGERQTQDVLWRSLVDQGEQKADKRADQLIKDVRRMDSRLAAIATVVALQENPSTNVRRAVESTRRICKLWPVVMW